MFSRTLFVPAHTVFAKTFFMEMERGKPETSRPIETQLLHFDGSHWHGYTYAWNDAGTDAERDAAGEAGSEAERDAVGEGWHHTRMLSTRSALA